MAGQQRQMMQDANAASLSASVAASRSVSKANAFYCNDAWDLVDALKNGKAKFEDLKDEDFPEEYRKLGRAGRQAKLDEAVRDRAGIQGKILTLNKDRDAFLAAERAKRPESLKETLDRALVDAIRTQAVRCRISFD
jgi:hypothetical protein